MAYVKPEYGHLMNATDENNNFQWVWDKDIPPIGTDTLEKTTGVYDLGSASYRFNRLYTNNIGSGTTISNIWQRIANFDVGGISATSTLTLTGLNGDSNVMYKIFIHGVQSNDAQWSDTYLTFNADSASNYGNQVLAEQATAIGSARSTGNIGIYVGRCPTDTSKYFSNILISAETGSERIIFVDSSSGLTATNIVYTFKSVGIWNNTSSTITSMTFQNINGGFAAFTNIDIYTRTT